MKKNALAMIALALLLAAPMAGCRRAKPAVVSDVQVTPTTTLAAGTGRTVVPVSSPSPTPKSTPEITSTPTIEAATPTSTTEVEHTPTAAPTSTPVPTAAPTAIPTKVPTTVPTTAATGERTHVVQPGENLFRISLYYGLHYETVAAANGIINPNLIYVGQTLTIPAEGATPTTPEGTHVVQAGENLFRIALNYGITVEALAVANNISDVNLIYPGQRLVIP